jgi:hypothetical protein
VRYPEKGRGSSHYSSLVSGFRATFRISDNAQSCVHPVALELLALRPSMFGITLASQTGELGLCKLSCPDFVEPLGPLQELAFS